MKLVPQNPWGDGADRHADFGITPVALDVVTEVLPLDLAVASAALKRTVGVGTPEPMRSVASEEVCVLWFGAESVLVIGAAVDVEGAFCVDQSDGWAAMELTGDVREVLARLCPLDLRDASFPPGASARTLLNHVSVSLTRVETGRWLLLVPRTVAGSVLAEVVSTARTVASR